MFSLCFEIFSELSGCTGAAGVGVLSILCVEHACLRCLRRCVCSCSLAAGSGSVMGVQQVALSRICVFPQIASPMDPHMTGKLVTSLGLLVLQAFLWNKCKKWVVVK